MNSRGRRTQERAFARTLRNQARAAAEKQRREKAAERKKLAAGGR